MPKKRSAFWFGDTVHKLPSPKTTWISSTVSSKRPVVVAVKAKTHAIFKKKPLQHTQIESSPRQIHPSTNKPITQENIIKTGHTHTHNQTITHIRACNQTFTIHNIHICITNMHHI